MFLQNIHPKHIFRFSEGGGYSVKLVLSLCNQISTSTFDLWFALLVPPQSENASYAPEMYRRTAEEVYIKFGTQREQDEFRMRWDRFAYGGSP